MLKFTKLLVMIIFTITLTSMILTKTPIMLGGLVIFQSVLVALLITLLFSNSWFSFLIYMIFMGGILMLFCYIISIVEFKEKNMKKSSMITMMIFIMMFWSKKEENFMNISKLDMKELLTSQYSMYFMLSIFLMFLLLVIMIMVIMLTETTKGTMRSI